MSHADYIVTTTRNRKERKLFWDGSEPLELDHPATWVLEKGPGGVFARCLAAKEQAPVEFTSEDLLAGTRFELPESRGVSVSLRRVRPIRAAYHPAYYPKHAARPPQFFIFSGQRYMMTSYEPVARSYEALVEGKPIWRYIRVGSSYQVTALRDGVRIKLPTNHRTHLKAGSMVTFEDAEFVRCTVAWERHWWRVNRIPTPEELPPESFESPEKQERRWFLRFSAVVVSGLVAGFLVLTRISEDYKKVEIPPAPTTITLKQPKIIPRIKKPEPVKKPEPKVVKKELPKKPPKKKELPRKPPKKKELPRKPPKKKELPKKPPPKRPIQPVRPPLPPVKQPVAPKPEVKQPIAVAPPATATAKPVKSAELIQRENAAKQQAAKTQQLARALNFLSPSLNKKASGGVFVDKTSEKYNAGGPSAVAVDTTAKGASILNSIASNQVQQRGSIDTKSARNVISDKFAGSKGGRGKGLNEVQGKVSLQALYDPNAGADLGGALSEKGGLAMSGAGQVSESELQKVLAKHLSKFQYCYEKALLNDSTLGGTITMQWTIEASGAASDVRVARSQMRNEGLHACMAKELRSIRFPQPRGGTVTVRFPFSFTASTI